MRRSHLRGSLFALCDVQVLRVLIETLNVPVPAAQVCAAGALWCTFSTPACREKMVRGPSVTSDVQTNAPTLQPTPCSTCVSVSHAACAACAGNTTGRMLAASLLQF